MVSQRRMLEQPVPKPWGLRELFVFVGRNGVIDDAYRVGCTAHEEGSTQAYVDPFRGVVEIRCVRCDRCVGCFRIASDGTTYGGERSCSPT